MQDEKVLKTAFLNRRDWGSFLSTLNVGASYPKVFDVVKSSRDWFTQSAADASNWLGVSGSALRDKLSIG